MRNIQRLILILFGVIVLLGVNSSCANGGIDQEKDNYYRVRSIADPYAFDFISWEAQAIASLFNDKVWQQNSMDQGTKLRTQVESVLSENGISIFPPLNFKLEKPPHLLVISPRDRIYYLDRVMLRQQLSGEEMEKIEAAVDKLGLSSLVEGLGGFGATYPPIVGSDSNLTFIINTVVEEWLHQYLAFRPLGFLYLLDSLGLRQDRNIIVMNETLAGMISDEIGSQVYNRYYSAKEEKKSAEKSAGFDYNTEMRQTRRTADQYLSQGDIEGAERYMEDRRQVFLAHGYKIRKLNQAYFAFHGIYGKSPASVSPIRGELKLLRAKSSSLNDFLQKASGMTSYADLLEVLKE